MRRPADGGHLRLVGGPVKSLFNADSTVSRTPQPLFKSPATIYINGRFLLRQITGVERVAWEIVSGLDQLVESGAIDPKQFRFVVVAPDQPALALPWRHIELRIIRSRASGHLWEQVELPRLLDGVMLSLCNTSALRHPRQIVMVHDAAVFSRPGARSWRFRRWYQFLLPRVCRAARIVLTNSTFSSTELKRYCRLSRTPVVIPLGADHIDRVVGDPNVLRKHNLTPGGYLLAVASMQPDKNLVGIGEAARLLGAKCPDLILVGGMNPAIFRGAGQLPSVVRWIGRVDDAELKALYQGAIALAYPSFYEGFGLPPIEAMACGCPVIASAIPALKETCGDAAEYCDPHDSRSIADAILRVFQDPARRESLRAAGLRRVEQFAWNAAAESVWHAVQSVVKPEPAAGKHRVLFVDHTAELSGGELALLNLLRHLDRTRITPVVALGAPGGLSEALQAAGIETYILPLHQAVLSTRKDSLGWRSLLRFGQVWQSIRYTRLLRRFAREQRIDLIHSNSLKSDILAGVTGRLAGVPVVWHVRDRIADDYLPAVAASGFRQLSRWLPHFVIANSRSTLATLGLPASKPSRVIYSGVVASSFSPLPDVESQSDRPIRIAMLGRLSAWKGQHVFLRAAAEVRKAFPQAQFQIIGSAMFGEEAYAESLRKLVDELGLAGCVSFLGFRKDVPALLCELSVLVHASTTGEPFGQVIVEAMAAGLPVVATNGGGVPEIVVDGQTGLLVPMNDAAAMARAIVTILSDPPLAQRMGRLARERAADNFSIQQTAQAVHDVYDQVLRAAHTRSTRRGSGALK